MSDKRIETIRQRININMSDALIDVSDVEAFMERVIITSRDDARYLLDHIAALEAVAEAARAWRDSLAMDDFGDLYGGQAQIEGLCHALDALDTLGESENARQSED